MQVCRRQLRIRAARFGSRRGAGVLVADAELVADLVVEVLDGLLAGEGEEQLGCLAERQLEGVGDNVGRLLHVAKAVGFVNDDQIPRHAIDVTGLGVSELAGADDDIVAFKELEFPLADGGVVGLGLKDATGEKELVGEFLLPLLAEIRGGDDPATGLRNTPA